MTKPTRRQTVFAAAGLALAVLTVAAWQYSASQGQAAVAAGADLRAVYAYAAKIQTYRHCSGLTCDPERLAGDITGIIARAAGNSGIAAAQLVIEPEPPQRIGDSPYSEKPTTARLKGVDLEQLVKFVYDVAPGQTGVRAKTIRLSTAGPNQAGVWDAEVSFTYLIYVPAEAKKLR